MRLIFKRAAARALERVPADRRRQILDRLKQLAADPASRSFDVQPLAASDLLRLRVGDYRILFTIDRTGDALMVELVRTRGDVYRR